jgi:hypothetical protein
LSAAEANPVATTWQAQWIEVDYETRVTAEARAALLAGNVELLGGSQ